MNRLFAAIVFLFLFVNSSAQPVSPVDFMGYELGEKFTFHHQVAAYFSHLAATSDQVELIKYGESYEGRPLMAAFVSAPENLRNLEKIRKANLKRALMLDEPVEDFRIPIVWLSYNIHGNESVSTETAIKTIWELIRNGSEANKWLQEMVVVIDPCLNPDGRERYLNWYLQKVGGGPQANPDGWEHYEPWPGGRGNHYLFDLNRDWTWFTQQETRQRVALYNQWLPQIHIDFHEQSPDEPYYFAPAAEPYHRLVSDWQREFQQIFGAANAKAFDQNGWLYFTEEVFDLLYPGYGDTYPLYNGSIGMTFEQGGSGRAGLVYLLENEDTLTLANRVDHHFTSGITVLKVAFQNREKLLQQFETYFRQSVQNPFGQYKGFLIRENNLAKMRDFKILLDNLGISYGTTVPGKKTDAAVFGKPGKVSLKTHENDLLISAYQPKSVLMQVLFDPQPYLSDSNTYDITSWALPYLYNLETYALYDDLQVMPEKEPIPASGTTFSGKPYAYFGQWNSPSDARWLAYLWKKGVKARYSTSEIRIDGQAYSPGSWLITRADNRAIPELDRLIKETEAAFQVSFSRLGTGLSSDGEDLGSSGMVLVKKPEILLLGGEGVDSRAFGETWQLFTEKVGLPITVVEPKNLKNINLAGYSKLILPDGYYEQLKDQSITDRLKSWVEFGGQLILMEKAVNFWAEQSESAIKEQVKSIRSAGVGSAGEKTYRTEGAIFRISLNPEDPASYGIGKSAFMIKTNEQAIGATEGIHTVAEFPEEEAWVSGLAGENGIENLSGKVFLAREKAGKGEIIYFSDNPLFRGFNYTGIRIFLNTIFFRP